MEALQALHSTKPSEIVQWCKFNSRYRQPGKSVSAFVLELRGLADLCNYGAVLRAYIHVAQPTLRTEPNVREGPYISFRNGDGSQECSNSAKVILELL